MYLNSDLCLLLLYKITEPPVAKHKYVAGKCSISTLLEGPLRPGQLWDPKVSECLHKYNPGTTFGWRFRGVLPKRGHGTAPGRTTSKDLPGGASSHELEKNELVNEYPGGY